MSEDNWNWNGQYAPWVLLGLIFAAINYFVITPANPSFLFGLVYTASAWIIAILLYITENQTNYNSIAFFVGAILGCLPVMVGLGFPTELAAVVGFIGIIAVWLLNEQEEIGNYEPDAKYFAIVPMVIWILWSFMFFQQRMHDPALLPYQAIIYHGSLLLFSVWSTLRFLQIGQKSGAKGVETATKISYIFMLTASFGMLLMTQVLGWNLTVYLTSILFM